MNRVYQIASLVFLALSVVIAYLSLSDLQYYSRLGPGSGFFPFWLSVVLGVLSCIMLYQATTGPQERLPDGFFPSRVGYLRIGTIVLAISGVALLMQPLGFRLTILAFLLVLLRVFGMGVIGSVLIASLASLGVYALFVEVLQIPLPIGKLGV